VRLAALAACAVSVTLALALASGAAGAPTAPRCEPTESDVAGPFQTSGAASPRRSKIGTGHVLLVRVLRSPDCAPINGAFVQLWQASPGGRYDRRGRGSVVTGSSGAFRFVGPVPPSYEGRPAHLHIVVSAPGYEELLTRYVFPPGKRSGTVTLILKSFL
jgi:protocatechuate 3,4-dioxygenase beta subunit